MPKGLRRIQGGGDRHFITCSCYRRQAFLGSARRRDIFLSILDEVRSKYDFVVWSYVVMPEHVHLLVTEPRKEKLSKAMQVLKQRVSLRCRRKRRSTEQLGIWSDEPPAFWQPRYLGAAKIYPRFHIANDSWIALLLSIDAPRSP